MTSERGEAVKALMGARTSKEAKWSFNCHSDRLSNILFVYNITMTMMMTMTMNDDDDGDDGDGDDTWT